MTNAAYQRHRTELVPTSADIVGPFYKAGAPFNGNFAPCDVDLVVSGRVLDTNGQPIAAATLDFWQADENGQYDLEGFKFRGKQETGIDGFYLLQTLRPGDYQIEDNPPDFRCSHIHVKITAPGFVPLTTQLYFADDKYNATDHWFNKDRVIGPDGRFDFVLVRVP